jgi:hypothetical protein
MQATKPRDQQAREYPRWCRAGHLVGGPNDEREGRCRVCRVASKRRYEQSAKGRATQHRYNTSPKGRARNAAYDWTFKGMTRRARASVKVFQARLDALGPFQIDGVDIDAIRIAALEKIDFPDLKVFGTPVGFDNEAFRANLIADVAKRHRLHDHRPKHNGRDDGHLAALEASGSSPPNLQVESSTPRGRLR